MFYKYEYLKRAGANKTLENKVAIVYHPDYLIHTQGQHPERKERLEHILVALKENNLLSDVEIHEPKPASIDDLTLIHDADYIAAVEEACLARRSYLDMDTYIVPESYRIALLSAGGALAGLSMVMNKKPLKVFVLNRPPGHHAEFGMFTMVTVLSIALKKMKKSCLSPFTRARLIREVVALMKQVRAAVKVIQSIYRYPEDVVIQNMIFVLKRSLYPYLISMSRN